MALVAKAPASFTLHARNPQHTVEIGGKQHGLRPQLRLALRPHGRRRATLRHARRPRRPAQAGPRRAGPAQCRLGDLRAHQFAGVQAASAHHRLGDPPLRQELHGPGDGTRACRRRGRDGEDRHGRRLRRGQHGDAGAGQRQHAAGLGRDHAGRGQGLCARQPGRDPLALHAGRRQHPGLGRGHRGPAQCRGARRHGVCPGGQARRTGALRQFPRHRLDALGRAHGRHLRAGADELHDRPAGPALRRALALVRACSPARRSAMPRQLTNRPST